MANDERRRRLGRTTTPGAPPPIEFSEDQGTYVGLGQRGRSWRITRTFTGWRLEFSDPGDALPTYAGTHATVAAAQSEAAR